MSTSGRIKVLALTGIRSEYDLMYPLLKKLHCTPEFDLGVVVSGAHMTHLHGYSIRQIEEDGFKIVDRIENLLNSNTFLGKAKSSAILMQDLAQTLNREQPDLFLILGDREEAIIGALTASYMNIPVVHLAGGDNTNPEGGNVDEQVRHATTKLSHIHLTMMEEHSKRIIKMGEEPWRVFTVGSAGIDRLREEAYMNREELANHFGESVLHDYIILIYHPINSHLEQAVYEVKTCFEVCLSTGMHLFVGAPNSDPGSQDILSVIEQYQNHPFVHVYKNLKRKLFVNLLRHSKCLIGNSSLAIHEAPYLCLPAINVGERQRGRVSGRNVQFVPAKAEAIRDALKKALYDSSYRKEVEEDRFIYGDGYMVEKSLKILKGLPPKEKLLAKKITY
ncbi:MAG: UDP-N-acetylglucosamine 2-epimerase (hydrolyzing) [Brevibacillus sp.]|nr:UDP-N-acetylglucosamine 2-epimerase (hydrolyzing) [Brevibacillus sp.]